MYGSVSRGCRASHKARAEEHKMENHISGHTQTLALIGSPVGHSGSPAMYNYCFQKLGLDMAYVAFDVTLETLPTVMAGIKAMNFHGINITMPCKSAVVEYFDEVSQAARLMNACNTAVNENGRWYGHNTDGIGFVENLKAHGIGIAGKKITVLGCGGAGTAIAVQCALSGAAVVSIFNMKDPFFAKAEQTGANIAKAVPTCSVSVGDLGDAAAVAASIAESDILVNASRAGMAPDVDSMSLASAQPLRPGLVVCDTVYNPKETKLLRLAAEKGCTAIGGTGMLLYQGVAAFRIFTGKDMPVDEVKARFFS